VTAQVYIHTQLPCDFTHIFDVLIRREYARVTDQYVQPTKSSDRFFNRVF